MRTLIAIGLMSGLNAVVHRKVENRQAQRNPTQIEVTDRLENYQRRVSEVLEVKVAIVTANHAILSILRIIRAGESLIVQIGVVVMEKGTQFLQKVVMAFPVVQPQVNRYQAHQNLVDPRLPTLLLT